MSENNEPRLVLVRNARVGDYAVYERDESGNVVFHEIKDLLGKNPVTLRSAVNIARNMSLDVHHWVEADADRESKIQKILF